MSSSSTHGAAGSMHLFRVRKDQQHVSIRADTAETTANSVCRLLSQHLREAGAILAAEEATVIVTAVLRRYTGALAAVPAIVPLASDERNNPKCRSEKNVNTLMIDGWSKQCITRCTVESPTGQANQERDTT